MSDAANEKPLPVLFVGHGSPMNAIEDNEFSRSWMELGRSLPHPRAILCVSAHWETQGTCVTAMERPRTIHDFYGFPQALYEEKYPAPGSRSLAQEVIGLLGSAAVSPDESWGLDHGCWAVLTRMFPGADVPVVQLSLDRTQPGPRHFELAGGLQPLRRQGVLIVASGNLVHNLRRVVLRGEDFNEPFGLDWAIEANGLFKKLIDREDYGSLADYPSLGNSVRLAVPTPEHFLPLLYALALRQEGDSLRYFNDVPVAGSLTMTSLLIDGAS